MSHTKSILIVDDEASWLRSMTMTLNRLVPDAMLETCLDSRKVMDRLGQSPFSLVLLDLTMPYVSGEMLLEQIRRHHPQIRVIIVTGVNEVDTAVRCMRKGAYDFFVKTGEVAAMAASVKRALEIANLEQAYLNLSSRFLDKLLKTPQAFSEILTCSESMLDIFRYIEALSVSRQPMAICGESGTGKCLIAKAIHQTSCPNEPFVSINLASLDPATIDDTLFGHIKGAFAGADSHRAGLVRSAGNGVLFLDGIDELAPEIQSKLVTLVQTGEYFPLGSDRSLQSQCRILCAATQPMTALFEQGRLKEDLYYRLRAHQIQVPALRDRPADLPLLLSHYVHQACEELGKTPLQIDEAVFPLLKAYPFPGNVRELAALAYDAVSRSTGSTLCLDPFSQLVSAAVPSTIPDHLVFPAELPTLAQVSDMLIEEAMSRTAGNQSAAAALLGLSQPALSRRLAKSRSE
ncbi:sigma-54-dependent transcriptional regulator [Ferrimonas balearica]|uniref:sigma-54-dependent transcriptional regulator n=1 Tax=Ferrimonas balearica TaxID=44012 RepID=UPI001C98F947|nr:sigma-54 dependent transcriptional regulator [Ferrimonas balearica]MBY5920524.1 sigma-54 dependent transcriptional regulator [Ferrimonas balearica]MBY5996791.1 sigma-54 dependent transcriptional regulator [Ferrimonas balearica]